MFVASSLFIVIAIILVVAAIAAIVAVAAKKPETLTETGKESYFDGSALGLFGWRFLGNLLTSITFGIAFPWATCMVTRWEVKHTVINGRRLKFNGNGAQLFGKYILWVFLTIVTFGIYSIWMGLGIEKWKTKHIVYADKKGPDDSRFTGTAGGWFVNHLIFFLLTFFTFGIAYAWAEVGLRKWKAKNTVIGGSPLVFSGKGGALWLKLFICGILTPLTLGIYPVFIFPVTLLKWHYKNTDALYRTAPIIALSRSHEESANKDYAKIRLAANDSELAAVKSGYTGNETDEELENLANNGNIFAAYTLAKKSKGDEPKFEGRALELLKTASDAGHPQAIFDYSDYAENLDTKIALLEESAKRGCSESAWVLKQLYSEKAEHSKQNSLDLLTKTAYWFKVAIELEIPEAVNAKTEYDELLETIAILHAGRHKTESGSPVGVIIAVAIGGGVLLLGVLMVCLLFFPNVGFGARMANEAMPLEAEERLIIQQGSSEYCTVTQDDIVRYNESVYQPYDTNVSSNQMTAKFSNKTVVLKFNLGRTAYYNADEKMLYLDFGVDGISNINGSGEMCVYLVSEDVKNENGNCKVLSGILRPGEKITKIPCEFPNGISETKMHLIVINSRDPKNADKSSLWVADIYQKNVNISYEPINNGNENGDISQEENEEGNQPDDDTSGNDGPQIELSNTPYYDLDIGGVKTEVTDADIQIFYDMLKTTNIFGSRTMLTESTDTIDIFNDYVVDSFGGGMFDWFDFEKEYIPDPNPTYEYDLEFGPMTCCRYKAKDVDWVLKAVFNRDPIHYVAGSGRVGYYQDEYFIRMASENYAGNPVEFIRNFEGYHEYIGDNLYHFNIDIVFVDSIEGFESSCKLSVKARPMHSQNYGTYWQILECIGAPA